MKVSQLLIALVAMALLAGLWWTMRPAVPSADSAPQMQVFELALGDGKHWVAKRFRVEQGDRVHSNGVGGVSPEVRVPLPDGDRDHVLGQMRVDDDARVHLTMVGLDRHQLAFFGAEGVRGVRGHLDTGAPGGLEQRVRNLLEPRAVGATPVEEV